MDKKTKEWVAKGVGVLAALYLANFGAGIIEVIPDNAPLVGNLDEAAATIIVIQTLMGKKII